MRSDTENLARRAWSSAYYRQHPDDYRRLLVAALEELAALPYTRPVYPRKAREALNKATLPLLLEAIDALGKEQDHIRKARATVAAAMPRLYHLQPA